MSHDVRVGISPTGFLQPHARCGTTPSPSTQEPWVKNRKVRNSKGMAWTLGQSPSPARCRPQQIHQGHDLFSQWGAAHICMERRQSTWPPAPGRPSLTKATSRIGQWGQAWQWEQGLAFWTSSFASWGGGQPSGLTGAESVTLWRVCASEFL